MINKILFQNPTPGYTSYQMHGSLIYVPKCDTLSIDELQYFMQTNTVRSTKHKHFNFDNTSDSAMSSHTFEYDYIPCLYIPSHNNSNKLMLYFHGNAEDVANTQHFLQDLSNDFNVNIIAVEYPGYGIYRGQSTSERLEEDSSYVYKFVTKLLQVKPADIIIFGRSIGSGPATYLASTKQVGALILMSAYTSIRNIARDYIGVFGSLIGERFPNYERIKQVKCPVLFIHGIRDKLISYKHSERLCQLCTSSASLVLPYDMTHNNFNYDTDVKEPMQWFLEKNTFTVNNATEPLLIPKKLFIKPVLGNCK